MTGTQRGITFAQHQAVRRFLARYQRIEEFHSGACIGADYAVNNIVARRVPGVELHLWPCTIRSKQAIGPCHVRHAEREPMDRNQEMVNRCQILLAFPGEREEVLRSGTWATIRRARKAFKTIVYFFPDGTISIRVGR